MMILLLLAAAVTLSSSASIEGQKNSKCVEPEKCPLPPICATVLCALPQCAPGVKTAIPPGQCCPQCVCENGDEIHFPGDIFKVDCNTCQCTDNGLAVCTKIACADPCTDFECPTGSQCKVFEPTGGPFCEPSCDLHNGGCRDDEICSLENVTCVRAPCPQQVNCSPVTKCPPMCSPKFCNDPRNKRKPCSRPPPFTVPPCPDGCRTTFCKACYNSNIALPTPPQCSKVCPFPPSIDCLFKWACCVEDSQELTTNTGTFRCYEYPCPLKG